MINPPDTEKIILLALIRWPWPLSVPEILKRITTASAQGPSWREVTSTCIRMDRKGLIFIAGEQEVGGVYQPAYKRTKEGLVAAHALRLQPPWAGEPGGGV